MTSQDKQITEASGLTYTLRRAKQKNIILRICQDDTVLVKAPYGVSEAKVRDYVRSKEAWIRKHLAQREALAEVPKLTEAQIEELKRKAKEILPKRVAYYADIVGVTYGRITVRCQKTRWGSCSAQGNLNFNALLLLAPIEVLDSVIVHELCHRKQMNHSHAFYAEVYRAYPEYDRWNGWLKKNGKQLMAQIPSC